MRTRILTLTVFFLLMPAVESLCQDRGFGLGVIIGEPAGVSMKGWLSSTTAVDAGAAWSFEHETSFHIHADYFWHSFNVFSTKEKIALYYGIGGRFKVARSEDARLGARIVGGIDYMFEKAPFDLFLEAAPIVDLAPATELQFNGGFGARFFFK